MRRFESSRPSHITYLILGRFVSFRLRRDSSGMSVYRFSDGKPAADVTRPSLFLYGKLHRANVFQDAPKIRLRREAHGSISVQEGQPGIPFFSGASPLARVRQAETAAAWGPSSSTRTSRPWFSPDA